MVEPGGAEEAFKHLLSAVAKLLKPRGFKRQRSTFHWQAPNSWSVVNVQKSQWSSADSKTITINLAVASKPLLHLDMWGVGTREPPAEHHCDWRIRLHRVTGGPEQWWEVSDQRTGRMAAQDILPTLETHACPLLVELSPVTGLPRLCDVPGIVTPPDSVIKHRIAQLGEGEEWQEAARLLAMLGDDQPAASFKAALQRRYPAVTGL